MKIIDVNAQIGTLPILGRQFSIDNLLHSMQKHEVMEAIISSTIGNNIDFVYGNKVISDVINKYGNDAKLFGCVTVNCDYLEESQSEMRKYFYEDRFIALRLTAGERRKMVTLIEAEPILNSHRRFGFPVFVHAINKEEVIEIEKMAKKFDGMRFIILSMGEDAWKSAVTVADRTTNIFLEISGCTNITKIIYAIEKLGSRRLLYGSALPYVDGSVFKSLVENSDLEAYQKSDIYYNSAKKLFEWK